MVETKVKKYKGDRAYMKDAEKMTKAGWAVVSVVNKGKPWGFGGVLVKTRYLVTYTRDVNKS